MGEAELSQSLSRPLGRRLPPLDGVVRDGYRIEGIDRNKQQTHSRIGGRKIYRDISLTLKPSGAVAAAPQQ